MTGNAVASVPARHEWARETLRAGQAYPAWVSLIALGAVAAVVICSVLFAV